MTTLFMPVGFLPGSIGPGELLVIFVVILVLFGPRRLPSIARAIGKTLAELRRASQDFKNEIMRIDETPGERPADVEPQPNAYDNEADSRREDGAARGGDGDAPAGDV